MADGDSLVWRYRLNALGIRFETSRFGESAEAKLVTGIYRDLFIVPQ